MITAAGWPMPTIGTSTASRPRLGMAWVMFASPSTTAAQRRLPVIAMPSGTPTIRDSSTALDVICICSTNSCHSS